MSFLINSYAFGGGAPSLIGGYVSQHSGLTAGQESALNTFANALDTAGVWSKLIYCYPYIGSTAADLRLNLAAPSGSPTKNQMDVAPPAGVLGTNKLMGSATTVDLTYSDDDNVFTDSDSGYFASVLIGNNVNDRPFDIPAGTGTVRLRAQTNSDFQSQGGTAIAETSGTGIGTGKILVATDNNTNVKLWVNGASAITGTPGGTNTTVIPQGRIRAAACEFYCIGHTNGALSDAEASAIYNALDSLDTAIGR